MEENDYELTEHELAYLDSKEIQKIKARRERWAGVEDPGATSVLEIALPVILFGSAFIIFVLSLIYS